MTNKITFYVAGLQFADYKKLSPDQLDKLSSAHLELVPEPQNKYDPNAIAIYYEDDFRLGYVPKAINALEHDDFSMSLPNLYVLEKIKERKVKSIKVSRHDPLEKTHQRVAIEIQFEE